MIRDDWSFWAVLPLVLMVLLIGAYLVQLGIERWRGESSDLTSGGLWSAAGLLLILVAWVVPQDSPWRWIGLLGMTFVLLAGWLQRRFRKPAAPEA